MKYKVFLNQNISETTGCMELKICMSDKHHRNYKHTKFRQNPRGDPKFFVDLIWNDPSESVVVA